VNSPIRYYLDTSAQIERFGGSREKRAKLKTLLAAGRNATSSQVLREWNRIVLGACVALRNALADAKSWSDVVPALRKGFGRAPLHHWMVADWITRNDTRNLALIDMRAKDFQRVRARVMFHNGIEVVRDGTDCPVARRQPNPSAKGWRYRPTCKKTEEICTQPDFLGSNIDRARAAATALVGSSRSNDSKMGKAALKALDGVGDGATKGKACHDHMGIGGDICIALECGANEVLVATDASFDLICPAIEVQHKRL
jgi:hypothetical protein